MKILPVFHLFVSLGQECPFPPGSSLWEEAGLHVNEATHSTAISCFQLPLSSCCVQIRGFFCNAGCSRENEKEDLVFMECEALGGHSLCDVGLRHSSLGPAYTALWLSRMIVEGFCHAVPFEGPPPPSNQFPC